MSRILKYTSMLLAVIAIEGSKIRAQEPPSLSQLVQEFPQLTQPTEWTNDHWRRVLYMHKKSVETNVPISFYGRLVDQNGDPIQGAHISDKVHFV